MYVEHIKQQAPKVKRSLKNIVARFVAGESIIELAQELNYSPYLLLRWLVEQTTSCTANELKELMRLPKDQMSSNEVVLLPEYDGIDLIAAIDTAKRLDPMYGPQQDRRRYMIGIEYEAVLELQLSELGTSLTRECGS